MPCPYRMRVAACGERRPRTVPRRDPPIIGCDAAGIQTCVGHAIQDVLIGQICLLICHWGLVAQTSVCVGFGVGFQGDRPKSKPHRRKSLCDSWKSGTSAAKADLKMQPLCHG